MSHRSHENGTEAMLSSIFEVSTLEASSSKRALRVNLGVDEPRVSDVRRLSIAAVATTTSIGVDASVAVRKHRDHLREARLTIIDTTPTTDEVTTTSIGAVRPSRVSRAYGRRISEPVLRMLSTPMLPDTMVENDADGNYWGETTLTSTTTENGVRGTSTRWRDHIKSRIAPPMYAPRHRNGVSSG